MLAAIFCGIMLTAAVIGEKSLAGGIIGAGLLWGLGYVAYVNMLNWGWL